MLENFGHAISSGYHLAEEPSQAEPRRAEMRCGEMRRGFAVLAFAKRLPFDPAKLCLPSFSFLLQLRFQPTPS